jgi:hypothetical protein
VNDVVEGEWHACDEFGLFGVVVDTQRELGRVERNRNPVVQSAPLVGKSPCDTSWGQQPESLEDWERLLSLGRATRSRWHGDRDLWQVQIAKEVRRHEVGQGMRRATGASKI